MKFLHILFTLAIISTSMVACSQQTESTNPENYFGVDKEHRIIVIQESYVKILLGSNRIDRITLGNMTFHFTEEVRALKTTETYDVSNADENYTLYVTSLPLLKLNSAKAIIDIKKIEANLSYADPNYNIETKIGVELRGNTALTYPKKSYDLELRNDSVAYKTMDATLSDMRNDDDWHLNSLYNQPIKLRSYISNKLWLDVHKPSYVKKEPKAKSGLDIELVEVFLNDNYQGLYSLSEQVDRKQLKLKKKKNDTVRGELYKANSYDQATKFIGAPDYDEGSLYWAGFKVKYPFKDDYKAPWKNLADFMSFVSTSSDAVFTAEISKQLDLNNAIDYYLFVNLLRASDNLSKNYFLAKYKQSEPYFFVPWDLDGVLGSIQDGKRIDYTTDVLSNALFDRLIKTSPDNYKARLKSRWQELRRDVYSNESLLKRLNDAYSHLKNGNMYERDNLIWKQGKDTDEEYEYLKDWLKRRLEFLDGNLASL